MCNDRPQLELRGRKPKIEWEGTESLEQRYWQEQDIDKNRKKAGGVSTIVIKEEKTFAGKRFRGIT